MPQHEHRRPARLATTSRTSAWNGDRFAGRRAHLGQRLRCTDVAIVRQLASTTPACGYVEQPDITAIMSANLYGAYTALTQISRGFTLKLRSIGGHRSPRLRRRAHRRNTVFRLSSSPECAATQRSALPWQSAGTGFQPGSSGGSCPHREHLPSAQGGAEFGVLRIVPSVKKRPPAVVLEHCQGDRFGRRDRQARRMHRPATRYERPALPATVGWHAPRTAQHASGPAAGRAGVRRPVPASDERAGRGAHQRMCDEPVGQVRERLMQPAAHGHTT